MKNDKELMIERFRRVKSLNFVESNRRYNTGIGKTFEDYVGVVENNLDAPDFAGYEIKSHRDASNSYITLFTKTPSFPKGANNYLNSNFGTPYEDNENLNNLHTSIFGNRLNNYKGLYSFKLKNDNIKKEIRIEVYDNKTKTLLDDSVGYKYSDLERIIENKLKKLFYVSAETKEINGKEHFHFNKAEIYSKPSFSKFMELVENGKIMYDIRIGTYKSGRNYGKLHDHGSGFRIVEADLTGLYEEKEEVK